MLWCYTNTRTLQTRTCKAEIFNTEKYLIVLLIQHQQSKDNLKEQDAAAPNPSILKAIHLHTIPYLMSAQGSSNTIISDSMKNVKTNV